MKTLKTLIATALLATLTSPVFAASEANINVVGSIAPSTCSVVVPDGAAFKFGSIHSDELNSNDSTHLLRAKTIRIVCPAPTKLLVAFPFDNGGQLAPHASGKDTGVLAWWLPSANNAVAAGCGIGLQDNELIKVDAGDGNLIAILSFIRIHRGRQIPQSCPAGSSYEGGGLYNGAEDGYYIYHPTVKEMHIPRHLRMSINPRDELDTSGVIRLEGSASVVVRYL